MTNPQRGKPLSTRQCNYEYSDRVQIHCYGYAGVVCGLLLICSQYKFGDRIGCMFPCVGELQLLTVFQHLGHQKEGNTFLLACTVT
jgi:hypothetical protein